MKNDVQKRRLVRLSGTVPSAAGTYAVTANCAASSNYSAVTGASAGNFVINAATQPTTLVVAPTVPTSVTTGGSVNLSFNGGNGTGAVTYSAVALAQSPAAANAVSPRTIGLQCTINGAVLTPTGGTGVCQVTATKAADANYQAQTSAPFNITVTAVPSPAPIPTLSEWAEIMMMFLMILTVGWYGRRLNQR
ncbi:MAG: IPTL-CTERM sorting domain-containing protein [Gammaproteobacteria bacterium]|nr:IPTL-CTERM sorting domain-containing protein [Gammaproteobacteria bacterium]NBT44502.1 IPTL-CTERM sorting domain-containing protein [Gammaproteobacteria bacterium]NBY23886.1 IPTL-CTERM sorting domain-containing protein [Gammaproteobacteria bacterium]